MRVWGYHGKHHCGLDEVNKAIDQFSRGSEWYELCEIYLKLLQQNTAQYEVD
jgi:hypothetical protein